MAGGGAHSPPPLAETMATRIARIILDPPTPTNRIVGVSGLFGWTESEDVVIGEIEDGANYYVEVGR